MLNKLTKLRKLLRANEVKGYIISTKDEYLSEYPPASAKRLEYLTGFTGSNGLAVILEDIVLFFTDGRYLTQCKTQLDNKLYRVFDQKFLTDFSWVDYIKPEDFIAYDPHIFTNNTLFGFKNLKLKAIDANLIDEIWDDKPAAPHSPIYNYDFKYAGESSEDKIRKCRKFLEDHKAGSLVITNPESVCWLFNIRASDIEFSPILLAHACITKEAAYLFTDIERLDKKVIAEKPFIEILPSKALAQIIAKTTDKILFDDNFCSKYISDLIKQQQHYSVANPCMLWKACKNEKEIVGMREGHIQDGIAVCEFLAFLANHELSNYSEYDLGLKLTEFRSRGKNYVSDSFPAIIGFKDNGAVIHYRAMKETAKKIKGNGLLLIDSGGQYLGATTDITRVVSIGKPGDEHKQYYTKILKGHLALAMVKFPQNSVTGANLDVLARQFLWADGDDYGHGTGHGVGSFLSVHEGPQNISLNSYQTKFASGMVVSNEPGFYVPGEFGMRIENMMYVGNNASFLQFHMLTLVPYEKELIDFNLLTSTELQFLSDYYRKIDEKIMPHLSEMGKKWLAEQIM
jgi:Xaa-Pro aminopeptidase